MLALSKSSLLILVFARLTSDTFPAFVKLSTIISFDFVIISLVTGSLFEELKPIKQIVLLISIGNNLQDIQIDRVYLSSQFDS